MKHVYVVVDSEGLVQVSMPPPDGYVGPFAVPDDFASNQTLYRLIDGELVFDQSLADAHAEEVMRIDALQQRDKLLQACAYARVMRASMDAALRQAWDDYEAALMAIEEQEGFPKDVTWPVAPGA